MVESKKTQQNRQISTPVQKTRILFRRGHYTNKTLRLYFQIQVEKLSIWRLRDRN